MIMKNWKRACISRLISKSLLKNKAGFCLALFLSACMNNAPPPTASHLQYAEAHGYKTTLADLQEGRALVLRKCEGCHSLYRFKKGSPEKWPAIMDSMSIQAKLTPRQDTLIRTYLIVVSGHLRDSLTAAKAMKAQKTP